jgi:hypothetical protein
MGTYLTIQEASELANKSIQTIRRMVKSKKVVTKKEKTPQGFIYLVEKTSLEEFMNIQKSGDARVHKSTVRDAATTQEDPISEEKSAQKNTHSSNDYSQWRNEASQFNSTIQKLVEQNERDKDNFFNLIKTFQERVQILENHIKMLEAPPGKWWNFWSK